MFTPKVVYALGLLLLAGNLVGCKKPNTIVYVDNSILMKKATVFSQVRDSLKFLEESWKHHAAALKDSVDTYMKFLGSQGQGVSKTEMEKMQKEFQERQTTLTRFVAANQKKGGDLEKSLMEPALKRANAFIQTYRDKHGYSFILGTVAGGNILAAEKSLDITDHLISEMNKELK